MPEKDGHTEETLEVLAERVTSRLAQNGQHGALAEFAKYRDAVEARHAAISAAVPRLITEKNTATPAPKPAKATAKKAGKAKAGK